MPIDPSTNTLAEGIAAEHIAAEPWQGGGPEDAAARLHGRDGLVWLDSALPHPRLGRWSIVAARPRWALSLRDGMAWLEDETGRRRCLPGGGLHALACAVEAEPRIDAPAWLPFAGGAVGYLGFELGREVERLPATTVDDVGAPLLHVAWYDAALVWDGLAGRGWLAGRPHAVAALRDDLEHPACALPGRRAPASRLIADMDPERYREAVERARRAIRAGDIYQVNLAQRFSVATAEPGFDLYRRLRAVSPAPFAAYLDARAFGGVEVLSSSPERFLLADGDHMETRPIKGTRPRGADGREDAALARELLASEKDRAEHVMIVDLERNDLGRIARTGSVTVPELAALESYAQVHHLTSTVTARRRPGMGLEALLRATFPGGSISGAPKIRAIEIIDELEPVTRGVYTGAVGYISAHGVSAHGVSAHGRLDLNIAIRTITLADGVARFHAGGAIVHDSSPEAEYAETLAKARGMARALGVALPDEVGTGAQAGTER